MIDFAKYLPLSNRDYRNDVGVTKDRRHLLTETLREFARLSTHPLFTPDDTREMLRCVGLSHGDEQLIQAIGAGEASYESSCSIATLSAAVRTLLRLADRIEQPVELSDTLTGSVALYAATRAPFDRRAVLKGHTIRATDAEWSFGFGSSLEGSAQEILRFVLRLSDQAPRPPGPKPVT